MATALLKNQKTLGEAIKAKFKRFQEATHERKTIDYCYDKLTTLEEDFKDFQVNHELIKESPELDGGHEYFVNEYFESIQTVYSSYKSEINTVINLLKTFKDDNVNPHMTKLIDIEGNHELPKNPNPKENPSLFPPNLTNIFKAASIHNLNNSQASETNQSQENSNGITIAMKSLNMAIDAWHNAIDPANQIEIKEGELAVVQEIILSKWKTLESLQGTLMVDKNFDMNKYMELEQKVIPIIVQCHNENSSAIVQTSKTNTVKIPKLNVPKFKGDYIKWQSFKELFMSLIGNKTEFTDCEKLAYLQGQLEGEPRKIISSLPLINASYKTAWKHLTDRYENKHIIISKLFDRLFNGNIMKKYSIDSMKEVMDTTRECVDTLNNLGFKRCNTFDYLMYYIAERLIDSHTLSLYEFTLKASSNPRQYSDLMDFLTLRIQNLTVKNDNRQKSQEEKSQPKKNKSFKKNHSKYSTVLVDTDNKKSKPKAKTQGNSYHCSICNEQHTLIHCPTFKSMTSDQKYKKLKELKYCTNCLSKNHSIKDCRSSGCHTCNKKHHTSLHDEKRASKFTKTVDKVDVLIGSTVKNEGTQHVFLATAIIQVSDKTGRLIKARALLDSGSQINMMSEKLHHKLGLDHDEAVMKVSGIGTTTTDSKKRTTVQIRSRITGYETYLELYIIKQITTVQPHRKIEIKNWNIPNNISLADPYFNIPAPVDIIIGGELFFKLLSIGMISIGDSLPDLQNTVFGWVVTGKTNGIESNNAFVGIATETSLENQVKQFWKLEEKITEKKAMTQLEQSCEKFFETTTMRSPDTGKFIVKLQFTNEPFVLGNSEQMAIRRFLYLEKKFEKDPQIRNDYIKFMREYENLGHMTQINKTKLSENNYFIPHHAVHNPSSSTTKFRVVFDASAKTASNISLNDILANGPMLQQDLFSIIARFRTHHYVFSADITKMYRQVEVDPSHRKWQMIVWRETKNSPLRYYVLNTLTYGTTCASYLAIKSLQTLAEQYKYTYPLASLVAGRDFNVDDVMTGSNNLLEAVKLQNDLIKLCKKGDFHLHKWCSNHPMLLENIPKSKQEVSLEFNAEKEETKALGMKWIPTDIFMLSYDPKEHKRITKRTVLSETAQLFDPLRLVNPVIVIAKIFIQELWSLKLDWDAALPLEKHSQWSSFRKELFKLNRVKIPRKLLIENPVNIQLHAFSDASTRAYGGVFYLRSENVHNEVQVNIICSKSRVAPVSPTTLPRLELCAAVVSVDMAKKLHDILNINIDSITYWTDSEVVLSWLHENSPKKTFVANRVAHILRNTAINNWKYINTKDNPADLVSRGTLPDILLHSNLWWHGPTFLHQDSSEWPTIKPAFTVLTAYAKPSESHFIDKIQHKNSIRVLQRVVAYILRFKKYFTVDKSLQRAESKHLSIDELKLAMTQIIAYVQKSCFSEELKLIKNGEAHKTKFFNFAPFLDENGIIRVGGRIQAANISFEQKHPILLPKDHFVTKLILSRIHLENMHAGPQALLAIVRQQYWPENGKRLAQSTVKNCVICVRSKPILMQQFMGNLPAERVNMARAFYNVSIDFAGPITIHHKIRGKRTHKAYICVFACFTTKAVHLEAAADLTLEGFVNCLKRFIARRSAPKTIICDNATNFRGTYNQLTELTEIMHYEQNQESIIRYCQDHEIQWKFAPPRSPHFNGLAEAAVKSAKLHIKKVIHSVELTYDELGTILAEVEAILNSRPLTPMSHNPNDLQALTPGHFLVGKPLTCINDVYIPYTSKTKMWHKMVGLKNEFWKRWRREYISELQSRQKWTSERENIKKGTLVIIHDDDTPPLNWKMGRVTNIIPDDTGRVRVVDLHTSTINMDKAVNKKTGKIDVNKIQTRIITLRRAIHRICPLPVDTEHTNQLQHQHQNSEQNISEQTDLEQNVSENSSNEISNSLPPQKPRKKHYKAKSTKKAVRTSPYKLPSNIEPIAKRTRSKNLTKFANIFTIALTLFALFIGAFSKQCNYTSFSHNPGLYFESTGKMSLTNDKWDIISYMKLEPFCTQVDEIDKLIGRLDSLCQQMTPSEYCNSTLHQLRKKFSTATEYNDIIVGFSTNSVSRKGRECTDNLFSSKLTEISKNTTEIFDKFRYLFGKTKWRKICVVFTALRFLFYEISTL